MTDVEASVTRRGIPRHTVVVMATPDRVSIPAFQHTIRNELQNVRGATTQWSETKEEIHNLHSALYPVENVGRRSWPPDITDSILPHAYIFPDCIRLEVLVRWLWRILWDYYLLRNHWIIFYHEISTSFNTYHDKRVQIITAVSILFELWHHVVL
jgi:hypothetical protein